MADERDPVRSARQCVAAAHGYAQSPVGLRRINGVLAFVWIGVAVIGVVFPAISRSIPILFFISCYANVAGHWSGWQAARVEVAQEETDIGEEVVTAVVEKTEIEAAP